MQTQGLYLHQQPAGAPAAGDEPSQRAFEAQLHAVKRPPSKPWKKQEAPRPPRIYHIDPKGFRSLVQELTGKPKAPPLEQLKWSPASAISPQLLHHEWSATADFKYWDDATGQF
ncbi:uncharacterized protein LOC110095244 [Dendrobium catenatum]|uniref:VQ domain-containing protein n=1 Tax=Dendrobium catenatum TaxID=906689 RepID=A0A2I0VSJ3_9ASPA|nr:uncharacterized protein LOC110095244 [Dendrobium catenatum]PKU66383.1 hypothetical protein MA16_Dca009625 [Dendrobium catenatum]